ncbi:hypothetical protein Gohar_022714 [Gossypium harknessii]|uniref:Uncharacterized protein n=1 Tax=Gossypium harknessii TaxID=34285 RepID=A0A7J9HAL7_9ROSI|nr:hypothetical protein [Gossypium harknessii]
MPVAPPISTKCSKKEVNRGAWTDEEDQKLAQVVEIYGPKRWQAAQYRGNISDQEEDLILRLHKLLGNRWSLIAGRLPGRTDNEIKNYWNSHLSKKTKQNEKQTIGSRMQEPVLENCKVSESKRDENSTACFINGDDSLFDSYSEEPLNLEWTSHFFETDELWLNLA